MEGMIIAQTQQERGRLDENKIYDKYVLCVYPRKSMICDMTGISYKSD